MNQELRAKLSKLGEQHLKHVAKFNEFVDTLTSSGLESISSLVFGERFDTEFHLSFAGRKRCLRMTQGAPEFSGGYAIVRLDRSLDDSEWLKPITGHAIGLDDLGNMTIPHSGKGLVSNQDEVGRVFYFLLTGK
jgi:hypothetical protein